MTRLKVMQAAALAMGLGLSAGVAAAEPQPSAEPQAEPTTVKNPARFQYYMRQGLPPAYRGKTNPNEKPTVPLVIKGADLYNYHCSSCHGLMGFGDGAAGGGLRPRPADLAWSLGTPQIGDDFIYWTIAEGGAQFGSNMPAYKGVLKEYQIWQIVTYMRAAFEGREAAAPAPTKQAMADR